MMRVLELLLLRRLLLRRVGGGNVHRPRIPAGVGQLRRLLALRMLLRREAHEVRNVYQRRVGCRHRRWQVRPTFAARRMFGAWYTIIPLMRRKTQKSFFNFLRVTPGRFDELLAVVEPALERYRRAASVISPGERLAVTLRFLSSGDSMASMAYLFLISPSTLCGIIRSTCDVIWEVLKDEVFPAISRENWEQVAQDFDEMWNFLHCYGAIDGKHFQVQNFPHGGSDYFNYKGTFSIVLLALADAKLLFRAVDIGGRGRRSDGGLFHRSEFGRRIEAGRFELPPPRPLPGSREPQPFVMVADEAFGLTPNIMTPFPGQFLPDHKNIYNYRHCRARRVVENAFGVMTARWRLFRGPFIAGRRTARSLVQAGVALHNYMVLREQEEDVGNRHYLPFGFADHVREDGEVVEGHWRHLDVAVPRPPRYQLGLNPTPEQIRAAGAAVRESFVDYFLGPGRLAWQWRYLRHD